MNLPYSFTPIPSRGEGSKWLSTVLFCIVLLLFLFNAIYQYLGAGRDDIFIPLWAGKTLGTNSWFINYNGELQEIASSILQTLLAKLAYLCCAEIYYLANKLFGCGAALVTLVVIWHQRRIFFASSPNFSAIATAAIIGFNPSFAYWSFGGLETPYYALLILGYVALAIQVFNPSAAVTRYHYLSLTFIQILAILCRPEGFWLISITLTLVLLYWKPLLDRGPCIIKAVILPPLAFLMALFALRYAMTGAIFPNPVYAKVSISHLDGLQEGWNYLNQFYALGLIGVLLAGATLISGALVSYTILHLLLPHQETAILASRFLVPALGICIYEVFIILVKGDWMEYHRFLVPTLGLKALLLVMLGEKLHTLALVHSRRLVLITATAIFILSLAGELYYRSPQDCSTRLSIDFFKKFWDHPNDATIGLNCAHQRDGYAIRPFINHELSRYLAEQGHLTIVTYQGGYFPYFIREQFSSRDITLIDTTGLLNLEIARIEGEKTPFGNKYLADIPAILRRKIPGLSDKVSQYNPNMIYLLSDSDTDQDQLNAIGFERIHQAPGGVVYLKTGASTPLLQD